MKVLSTQNIIHLEQLKFHLLEPNLLRVSNAKEHCGYLCALNDLQQVSAALQEENNSVLPPVLKYVTFLYARD